MPYLSERRTSENAPSRNCPKSLGRARGVALRAAETLLFDPFRAPHTGQINVGALFLPLFGQFPGEVPRIQLLGSTVNKGKRAGREDARNARPCRAFITPL